MRLRRILLLGAGAILLVLAAAALQPEPRGQITVRHDGRDRTALIRIPPQAAAGQRLPALIVLHGGGGSGANAERMTQLTPFSAQKGFIVAYPNGTGAPGTPFLTWNAGRCCAFAMENQVDDVGFISGLIDRLVQDHSADPRRIFVTGMSNGGMMSHRVGVELGSKVAGIIPVAGALNCPLASGKPVSVLMIHGDADDHVLLAGGKPKVGIASSREDRSMQEALDYWVKRNGASPAPQVKTDRLSTTTTHPGPHPVASVVIKGEGHTWPGGRPGSRRGDIPTQNVSANELIWEFMSWAAS